MTDKIKIAVDAMGGENSPKKIIEGIKISLKTNIENRFFLFGNENLLNKEINKDNLLKKHCEIINAEDVILDNESPLSAAKKSKKTSMWKAIESQKNKLTDVSISAGNTGALLVISRIILSTIKGINKPALAGLWPNKYSMNIVLDLGANVECDDKTLVDFACMGSSLSKSLFQIDTPKIALLNIGLEENKGNNTLKKTFNILKNNHDKNFNFLSELYENKIDNLFSEFLKFSVIKLAVPSAVFNATFPVKPSVTITSAFPSII